MDSTIVLQLVKARMGISSSVRDTYLQAIIEGVKHELTDEKGIVLNATNPNHLMFVVDYSTWMYENKDSMAGMPRHLQFRLHNIMLHDGGGI